MYTSQKLSKWLKENECELKSDFRWEQSYHFSTQYIDKNNKRLKNPINKVVKGDKWRIADNRQKFGSPEVVFEWWYKEVQEIEKNTYLAYDILNDICVKYAKEFFGTKFFEDGVHSCSAWVYHPIEILGLLQMEHTQEAEDYFWEHTIFNKK